MSSFLSAPWKFYQILSITFHKSNSISPFDKPPIKFNQINIAYEILLAQLTHRLSNLIKTFHKSISILCLSNLIRTGLVSVPIFRNLGNFHQIISVKKSSTLLSIAFHWISIKFNPYQTCINFYTLEFKKFLSNIVRQDVLYISIRSLWLGIYQIWSTINFIHFYISTIINRIKLFLHADRKY